MKYRLVIFDFDGTLADSLPWFVGAVNQAAEVYGFRKIEGREGEALRGYDARKIIDQLGLPTWKLPLVARFMRRRMAADIGAISLFPGVDALLGGLAAQGTALAVVSSNSADNVRRVLGPVNQALIRHYGCGASIFGKRPRLRQVLRDSGVAPAHALCVGDEIRDIHAAHAEGIAFGAVGWGYTTPDALAAHHPEEFFADVESIVAAVAHPARGA